MEDREMEDESYSDVEEEEGTEDDEEYVCAERNRRKTGSGGAMTAHVLNGRSESLAERLQWKEEASPLIHHSPATPAPSLTLASPSPRNNKMTLRSVPKVRIPSLTLFRSSGESAVKDVEKRFVIAKRCRSTSGTVVILERKGRRGREGEGEGEAGRFAVMKRQAIRDTAVKEKAAREIRIMEQLSSLSLSHRTPNFIRIEKWFNSSRIPFLSSSSSPSASSSSTSASDLYIVMEYAELSLSSLRPLSLSLYRSILFQLLFTLSVAQNEYLFIHNDLHLRNILLQNPSPARPILAYHDRGMVWFVQGTSRHVILFHFLLWKFESDSFFKWQDRL